MISHWQVVREVANRYGDREDQFVADAGKMATLRNPDTTVMDMEDDAQRRQFRLARENTPNVREAVERLISGGNFQDKYVLEKLAQASRAVCRILMDGSPVGTGFLVTPDIMLTNHHVIEDTTAVGRMIAEFNYEVDGDTKTLKRSACFKLDAQKFFLTSGLIFTKAEVNSGLDFTLVGVNIKGTFGEALSDFPCVRLDGNPGKIIKGESCVIIQHPNGMPKKVVLKDTRFFSETGTRLVYETDTMPGSSGSPVFALGTCEIIALHHSGLSKTDANNNVLTKSGQIATPDTPDNEIDWIGNEGIRVSVIVDAIQTATLPAGMEAGRAALVSKTRTVAGQLKENMANQQLTQQPKEQLQSLPPRKVPPPADLQEPAIPSTPKNIDMDNATTTGVAQPTSFILTTLNKPDNVNRVNAYLSARYGTTVQLRLLTPNLARPGEEELYGFTVNFDGNPHEEAKAIASLPGVFYAEADVPLYINADTSFVTTSGGGPTESASLTDDGFGTPNENDFLAAYAQQSVYVKGLQPKDYRRWSWAATGFDKVVTPQGAAGAQLNITSPLEAGIRVVQFDTGYSNHSKVQGQFDTDHDFNFVNSTDDALDPRTTGFGKMPGHGTRTGSLLVGNDFCPVDVNGNCGLLTNSGLKLVPFRIAETVIIINRQQELAAALDTAIAQGYDVISMSMGLPPTITTAKLARKAYDAGVIWCCAAGNEVGAVVAPAVYPGTIAVAASNPFDADWKGSCRGDSVDITAPGERVYVPIWVSEEQESFAYGNGTSYATPHVAAAAVYWLAQHRQYLHDQNIVGWKRVALFRKALMNSARTQHQLPPKGFGAGILNVVDLLTKQDISQLVANLDEKKDYAYNNWSDKAFFSALQGWGEAIKTYWNLLHGGSFKKRAGSTESLGGSIVTMPLSDSARQLETAVFGRRTSAYESATEGTPTDILQRFNTVAAIVEQSAK